MVRDESGGHKKNHPLWVVPPENVILAEIVAC